MLPNPYIIKSKKQRNEIWEFPYELKYIDKIHFDTDKQMILASAIITAVAEYTKKSFEVYASTKTGLVFRFLDKNVPKIFFVILERYKLEGNKLILIKGEKDV